mmetsp:Transcript_22530/g.44608  ORF Transcript_22530/g.44608 Transcript_22530/m.44608 type:complete len:264 (+) Transcript_22530:406-1197(+)
MRECQERVQKEEEGEHPADISTCRERDRRLGYSLTSPDSRDHFSKHVSQRCHSRLAHFPPFRCFDSDLRLVQRLTQRLHDIQWRVSHQAQSGLVCFQETLHPLQVSGALQVPLGYWQESTQQGAHSLLTRECHCNTAFQWEDEGGFHSHPPTEKHKGPPQLPTFVQSLKSQRQPQHQKEHKGSRKDRQGKDECAGRQGKGQGNRDQFPREEWAHPCPHHVEEQSRKNSPEHSRFVYAQQVINPLKRGVPSHTPCLHRYWRLGL